MNAHNLSGSYPQKAVNNRSYPRINTLPIRAYLRINTLPLRINTLPIPLQAIHGKGYRRPPVVFTCSNTCSYQAFNVDNLKVAH